MKSIKHEHSCKILYFGQIFNTTSRIGIYCGTTLPKLPRSPLKQLIIHFHTDGSIEGAGFNITFNEGYGKSYSIMLNFTMLIYILHAHLNISTNIT